MHFASLLVLVLDFDYLGYLCLCACVCVSVMRGCLAGEGGELGFTAQVTCTWRNAHTSARSRKDEVIHLKVSLPSLLAADIYSCQCIRLD